MSNDFPDRIPASVQDGGPDELNAEYTAIINRVKKDRGRLRRIRVVTIVLWGMVIVGYLTAGLVGQKLQTVDLSKKTIRDTIDWCVLVFVSVLAAAIVCTVSLYIRWRSFNQRQILASLTGIEKALQELSRQSDS